MWVVGNPNKPCFYTRDPEGFLSSDLKVIRVGVTGFNGRLGTTLRTLEPAIVPLGGDITDPDFDLDGCDVVINCAAKTDVCYAELHEQESFQANVHGPYNLARLCIAKKARLIHISTDHVFGKRSGHGSYSEEDETYPVGVYARTKALGEKAIEHAYAGEPKNFLIIRTSFIQSFSMPQAFIDKYFSGDTIDTIAVEILKAIQIARHVNLLHIGTGKKSIYDVARRFKPDVEPMFLAENPTNKVGLAYIPDTSLDSSKWEELKKDRMWV